jgi:hypothetical protein
MGGMLSRKVPKPAKTAGGPNVRDKLSEAFLKAFEADFAINGVDVIQRLRVEEPAKYAELAAKLIVQAAEPPDPSDFRNCRTPEAIGRKLLQQIGVSEDQLTDDMARQAADANEALLDRLLLIAEGN